MDELEFNKLNELLPVPHFFDKCLNEALTSKPYTQENGLNYQRDTLAKLGDALIRIVLIKYLYLDQYRLDDPTPELSILESGGTQAEIMRNFFRKANIDPIKLFNVTSGEINEGVVNGQRFLSQSFEALVGATYLWEDVLVEDLVIKLMNFSTDKAVLSVIKPAVDKVEEREKSLKKLKLRSTFRRKKK